MEKVLFIRELHIAVEFYNKMVAFVSVYRFIIIMYDFQS